MSHNIESNPFFIGTSARRLSGPKVTKLRPSEWCTYIRSCRLAARKASDTPPHRCTSSWGPVSWQHSLIGLAGLRQGLAQSGGIRSLPLIISSPCTSLRAQVTRPQNQSTAIASAAVPMLRQASQRRQRGLCSRSLATQITCHCVAPLPPLTVTGHVIVMEELRESLLGSFVRISLQHQGKI